MNKYQKELIEKSKPYVDGTPFRGLYIIPGGKLYRGFWGVNGYNRFYLVCETEKDEHYVIGIDYQCDVGMFQTNGVIHFDIPKKLDCLHCWPSWSKANFIIRCSGLSSITIEEVVMENANDN